MTQAMEELMSTESPEPQSAAPRKYTSESPAVSIITPAFNAARFIGETIESVQAQTFGDWEMVITDDDSRDETREIVSRYAEADPRIRLVALDENVGPALARKAALDRARARYVAFLDSDDLWAPEKLELQLNRMRERDLAFTFTSYDVISEDGKPLGRMVESVERVDYRSLLKNTNIGCLTVMLDRERTGPLRVVSMSQHVDLPIWYGILKRGIEAHGIPERLATYRLVGGSVSNNKLRSAQHMWEVYREVEKLSWIDSLWCFTHYAWHAYRKHYL